MNGSSLLRYAALSVALCMSSVVMATSFIMPTDEELIDKASAVVVGTVEATYVQQTETIFETVNEIRIDRVMKGGLEPGQLIRVMELGGFIEGIGGSYVPGAPRFEQGQRVLLFLTRDENRWRTTDMTLGRFKFVTSTAGERLLVREMEDVVGWDHAGREHHENVRKEEGFLRFIEAHIGGRGKNADYLVDSASVTLKTEPSESRFTAAALGTFPPATYTSWVSNRPTRWANISGGVTFYKNSNQDISGAADGGVAAIQSGLGAWSNECGSVINLIYGGERATASVNQDGVSMVEYNDPQSRISGSWTGSGTIGITFSSFSGTHSFSSTTWWSFRDSDIVFQNGFPATHAAFPAAMTHELGHAIGWRHSNEHYLDDLPCDPSVEECTSAAIMNSSVSSAYGYTLQPWDITAARAVYPGGTCGPSCTPPGITSQPTSRTNTAGTSTTLTVTATGTPAFTYQWFTGTSGSTANPVAGGTSNTLTVSPSSTTSYWVRVSNGCGSVNSATATVTVNPPAPALRPPKGDYNGNDTSDIFWRNVSTGQTAIWFMDGTPAPAVSELSPVADQNWSVVAAGDFNGNGTADVLWRNESTGENTVWLLNGATISFGAMTTVSDTRWQVRGAGDFNGDGRADLLWRHTTTGQNVLWFMNGFTYSPVEITRVADLNWNPVAFGYFNDDNRADIFWRNPVSGDNTLWFMNGSTPTFASLAGVTAPNWAPVAAGDFNGDSRDDVMWRNQNTGESSVWFLNGASMSAAAIHSLSAPWVARVVGDFNADGRADIFWMNAATGQTSVWHMNGATDVSRQNLYTLPVSWEPFTIR